MKRIRLIQFSGATLKAVLIIKFGKRLQTESLLLFFLLEIFWKCFVAGLESKESGEQHAASKGEEIFGGRRLK